MKSKSDPVPSLDPRSEGDSELTAELLRRVQRLELVARRNAAGLAPGDYETAVRGQGLLFHEVRKYVPGEPARHIDWNITARLADPHVRVYLEERQREVVVLLDVSPSMHAGLARRTKLELAVELAATLGAAAIHAGDRLGHVLYADRVLHQAPPRQGRSQLFLFLRALLENTVTWQRRVEESDAREAFHALEGGLGRGRRGRRGARAGTGLVVFVISDFVDHDLPEDLRYLRARHDVSLLHVYDPFEHDSGPVRFPARSPEGRRHRETLSSSDTGSLEQARSLLRRRCGEAAVAFGSFSTAEPARASLAGFFHHKRRPRGG